jgi:hypothetical protein
VNAERRRVLIDIAERWAELAEERDRLVKDHPDLFGGEADNGAF